MYAAKDNAIFTKDMKRLVWCPPQIGGREGTYVVPDGTEEILPLAFGETAVDTVVLPKSLKKWHRAYEDDGMVNGFMFEDYGCLQTIVGISGSYAEELAEDAGFAFTDIEDWEDDD